MIMVLYDLFIYFYAGHLQLYLKQPMFLGYKILQSQYIIIRSAATLISRNSSVGLLTPRKQNKNTV
jgi:hypothetical protein